LLRRVCNERVTKVCRRAGVAQGILDKINEKSNVDYGIGRSSDVERRERIVDTRGGGGWLLQLETDK